MQAMICRAFIFKMQHTILTKPDIPEDRDEKEEFAKKLMTYMVCH